VPRVVRLGERGDRAHRRCRALDLGSVTRSPAIGSLLAEAAGFNFSLLGATLDEGHFMANLIETAVEPGDPLVFAGNIVLHPQPLAGQATHARDVLQFEVLYDEVVSDESNEALARAGGRGLAQPSAGSNAGILDYKQVDHNPGRVPLPSVAPQSDGTIHDTPAAGVTAVVVQESPGTHGMNMVASTDVRRFCIPYGDFATGTAFHLLNTDST
jgi:hypothetical protein